MKQNNMANKRRVIFSNAECNLFTLKSYCDLLKSHYSGDYKLIVNSCNNILLSTHHLTTIDHVEFKHPLCQFLSHFIKEMPNSGLYCAIIATSFLVRIYEIINNSLVEDIHLKIIACLERVKKLVVAQLEKEKVVKNLEANGLISIVNNKLITLQLDHFFAKQLAVSLVKAIILATDDCQRLGHISMKIVNGKENCEIYKGILYQLDSFWASDLNSEANNKLKILIFTEPLKFNADANNSRKNEFIENIIGTEIKIIACQKPIDKKIIFLLRRHNVLVLERLGEVTAIALTQLSGAFPISDCERINWRKLQHLIGEVSRIKYVTIMNERFLLLERDGASVVTLFVSYRNFETSDQLRAILKESMHDVYSLLKCPHMLTEGFELTLAKQLEKVKDGDVLFRRLSSQLGETVKELFLIRNKQQDYNYLDIYVVKKNSFMQAISIVANLLQVGMFATKS